MFKNITIGQYFPAVSPLHRLDARIKLILAIAYLSLIFAADTWVSYIIVSVYTAVLVMISNVPLKIVFKGLKPVMFILIFTVIINMFTIPGTAAAIVPILRFTVTYEGILSAAFISVRLVLIVIAASLLTLTTEPLCLTDAIERLLKPLEKIKVPARDIAMMMTIAIRFIPTLSSEAERIKKAQMSRGADFESGNIIKRAKALLPLTVPLFVSALRRAQLLSEAMDARCYGGGKRTRMKEMKITAKDIAAIIIFIFCAAVIIAAEFVIEF